MRMIHVCSLSSDTVFFVTKAMALSLREIYEVYRAVATSADIVVT